MNKGYASPSSSPPTSPTPLPISVGPGEENYLFSSSPSPSPPFSPRPSSHSSAENLPLLQTEKSTQVALPLSTFSLDLQPPAPVALPLSAFSLHLQPPDESPSSNKNYSSCLQDLLEWLILRCCNCCSWSLPKSQPLLTSSSPSPLP